MSEGLPHCVSRKTAEHYVWGEVSDGWRLSDKLNQHLSKGPVNKVTGDLGSLDSL